ncbi:MAG: zeta toxin family protein [Desulfovibrio sp.]|nr:zeta toxin family protein [Desulfovibrio sp.]
MTDLQKPVLIVVAGPNGAGETSLTEKIILHRWMDGCTYINPDLIARDMFGDWNSADAVSKAVQKAQAMREETLERRESMAFETVFSAANKIDFLLRARNAGYFLRLFFISTTHPSINAARVAQRVMEGGHSVPIPKIINRYAKSIANCAAAATFVDRAYIYDNSVDGREPLLLFRTICGSIARQYHLVTSWAQTIADELRTKESTESISPE